MKRYVKASRYYVTNEDYILLHAQPAEGYTKLQAIQRAQREVRESANLFGGRPDEYTSYFHIVDDDFNRCPDLDSAI